MLLTSRYSDWFWLQGKWRKSPISLHLKIFCCLNWGGAHVNPLGPHGILLCVVNYVIIYFFFTIFTLVTTVRNVAVVTLVTMVTKVTSFLWLLWLSERAGSVPLCRLVLSCYSSIILKMFILNSFAPNWSSLHTPTSLICPVRALMQ